MTKTDEENSICYHSDITMRSADEVDQANLSNSYLEKVIFDDNTMRKDLLLS